MRLMRSLRRHGNVHEDAEIETAGGWKLLDALRTVQVLPDLPARGFAISPHAVLQCGFVLGHSRTLEAALCYIRCTVNIGLI